MTPNEIARLVGRSPKTVRAYLRKEYVGIHRKGDWWYLAPHQAQRTIAHFCGLEQR